MKLDLAKMKLKYKHSVSYDYGVCQLLEIVEVAKRFVWILENTESLTIGRDSERSNFNGAGQALSKLLENVRQTQAIS